MPFSNILGGEGFLRERLSRALTMPIRVFGETMPRYRWLGIALVALLLLIAYGILTTIYFVSAVTPDASPLAWLPLAAGTLGALAWFYLVLRIFRVTMNVLIVFTLLLAGASFLLEASLLDGEIFGKFTPRTIWALCIAFAALALYPFHARLPRFALPVLAAVYVAGALLCIPFMGPMLPFMAFSWMAIPFAGLGFLPYSPLLAAIMFSLAAVRMHRHAKERYPRDAVLWSVRGVMLATALGCSAYAGWFLLEWNRMNTMVDTQKNINWKEPNRLDNELPVWTALAMRFPEHHAARMYLRGGNRSGRIRVHSVNAKFDPLSYAAYMLLDRTTMKGNESEKIFALITGDEHTNLERLWSGENLKTVRVRTHVQIFPETRTAYTETTLTVHNGSTRTREAIYSLKLPPGSVASQLSLWINGREEPARLALKEKARAAYRRIVGVEARDPALLEWREGSRMRLRVFPVLAGKSRKVRFGIVSPLRREWTSEAAILSLPAIKIIGTRLKGAEHDVTFDVVSPRAERIHARHIIPREIAGKKGMRRFHVKGEYNQNWRIHIDAPERIEGRFVVGNDAYIVEPAEITTAALYPDDIYLLINDALSSEDWIRAYREIMAVKDPRTRVIIAGTEKFHSRNRGVALEYLRKAHLPRMNLFPFHRLPRGRRALLVTAGESRSTTISDMAGSKFHERITRYFARRKSPVYVASLNGRFSDYMHGLVEFDRVRAAAYSRPGLIRVLRTNKVEIPHGGSRGFAFAASGMRIRRVPASKAGRGAGSLPGFGLRETSLAAGDKSALRDDSPARLFMYRKLMRLIGRSHFRVQADKKPAMRIAADAMLVSPVSSLVVLESERDYNRFGIKKNKSKLGQSKKFNPSLGLVPEPEEWALMILILMVLLYHRREQLTALLRRFTPMGRAA